MSLRMLEAGIAAVQAGNLDEGRRLLKIALKTGELTGELSAITYLWLAETSPDPEFKRECYSDALTADPGNADARQRLATMLSASLPATPKAPVVATPPPPQNIPEPPAPVQPKPQPTVHRPAAIVDYLVRIIGGPNGPGTGFFVHPEGLLVTTRYITGGLEKITVELATGRQVIGQVIRGFPDMDLSIIHTEERLGEMLPLTPYPRVQDEAPLTALTASGDQLPGKQRPTKRVMNQHWIPTDFTRLADAGGNPLFDEQRYLIGMMTKNSSRSSGYLFGVHITAIQRSVAHTLDELRSGERRTYCPGCGSLSRAIASGYFYCDVCGSVAPQARQIARRPQENPFVEYSRIVCTNCGARVGFHKSRCLRCGFRPGAA